MSVKSSEVEMGYYYEKAGTPGWLRLVIEGGQIGRPRYATFCGFGQCNRSALAKWSSRRLTVEQATTEFPDEVAKIRATISSGDPIEQIFDILSGAVSEAKVTIATWLKERRRPDSHDLEQLMIRMRDAERKVALRMKEE